MCLGFEVLTEIPYLAESEVFKVILKCLKLKGSALDIPVGFRWVYVNKNAVQEDSERPEAK